MALGGLAALFVVPMRIDDTIRALRAVGWRYQRSMKYASSNQK